MNTKQPFSKVSDLQHWLGMSENGLRLYEKEGIISPERNEENGYRQLNISDGDKMFQGRIYTGYGLSLKQTANLLQTADFKMHYLNLEELETRLQEEILLANYKAHYLNLHIKLLRKFMDNPYDVQIVPNPQLAFLPVHDQHQNKANGEGNCADWLSKVPFVRSAVMMKLESTSYPTVWFGPVTEQETAQQLGLPLKNAVIFSDESPQYVMGFAVYGINDFLTEDKYRHLLTFAEKQGYECFGTLFSRHLMLEKQGEELLYYDQIWIPARSKN